MNSPCFADLLVVVDQARSAPVNMAVDQALLETTTIPVLRVYHWNQPSISIGYSHDYSALKPSLPNWPVVRRWTGGGVVWHQNDSTYSLIVPSSDPWSQTRPVESYRQVHGALVDALNVAGFGPCHLVGEEDRKDGALCFEAPALFDIARAGVKIAGAGQRRSRQGLLHQGSLKLLPGDGFWENWAHQLAHAVTVQNTLPPGVEQRAAELAATRYGTEEWMVR